MSMLFTWYGHGTFGLETDGYKILIDPYFTDNPSARSTADQVGAGSPVAREAQPASRTSHAVPSSRVIFRKALSPWS